MSKQLQKNIATSLTALTFLVIGVSGILMFFHILDDYTKELHEIIGLFFVGVVLLHVFYNLKSMTAHLKTKAFHIGALLLTIVSLGFILNAEEGGNPKKDIIMSVLNTPLENSVKLFNKDMLSVESKLKEQGIVIEKNDSIESISKRHNKSPFDIIALIK